MSPDAERPREESRRLPPEESWRVGRPWVGVIFVLFAVLNLFVVVTDATGGFVETTRDRVFWWVRVASVVVFLAVALTELRRRASVDAAGVHVTELRRRRTYRWQDISEVRAGRPVMFGDRFVYLLRHGDKHVELPQSGGHLRLLQRWHEAVAE